MTGVGEAYELNLWQNCGFGTMNSFKSCRIFPVARSTQIANSSCPSSGAVVNQIRSSQITGDDHALPWIAVFHFTLFVSLQVSGKPLAPECPSPFGPRNCGHCSAACRTNAPQSNAANNNRFIARE